MFIFAQGTPRPNGRTTIACQRMIDRLKTTLKDDLEALKDGKPVGEVTPKGPKTPKRKKADANDASKGDAEGSPKKRGRKKADAETAVKNDAKGRVKDEVKDEEDVEV